MPGCPEDVAVALKDLPKYLVLDPESTVRLEMKLEEPSCEIDVELDNPKPGRSFVLLIGHREGPFVQRVRLAGRARIHFDPEAPGEYQLLLANPDKEPVILRLKARNLSKQLLRPTVKRPSRSAPGGKRRATARSRRPPAKSG